MNKSNYFLLIAFVVILSSCSDKPHYEGPLSPEESMKTFHFAENFKAEIFATEPLVADPVSMAFYEDGNAYVVEMPDVNQPADDRGMGRIILLKDTNGDGRADTSTIFADSLREATDVLPWKGGLLIAAAPNILYYKDTDGDSRADSKEILFAGFFNKNEEGQISNLTFSIDNWIYANNAGRAGEITYTRKPNAPKLSLEGADFRFRLDKDQFERSTGPGQYGLAIDDWGHRFFTANSLHIRQVVAPLRYLERNPYLPSYAKSVIENISDHDPGMYQLAETPYWRQIRTDRRNKEFQENHLDRVEYARDHFTGSSGGTIYEGDAYPKKYYGNIFTGEVSGNLVHRDVLHPNDSVPYYTAQRAAAEKDKEFLAVTDPWFRPTTFSVGPDGYLYVIDMYRQHIEGSAFIPQDLKEDMDLGAGSDMGRIYRMAPKDDDYKKTPLNIRDAKSIELVALLSHQNQWWRLQAQRLLLERQDKSVLPAVKTLYAQSEDARFRLHALYVLEGMDALNEATVKKAMKDPSPGVRENAAIFSERFPGCLSQLKEMINDSSILVAFQATLSLGEFKDNTVISILAKVAEQRGQNPWFRTAVLSSKAGSNVDFLIALEKESFFAETATWKSTFLETFSNVIGARDQKEQIVSLLKMLTQPPLTNTTEFQTAVVKGLIEGQKRAVGLNASQNEKLKTIDTGSVNDINEAIDILKQLYSK